RSRRLRGLAQPCHARPPAGARRRDRGPQKIGRARHGRPPVPVGQTSLQNLSTVQCGRDVGRGHSARGTRSAWHFCCSDRGPMRALPWLITSGWAAMASVTLAAHAGCPPDSVAVGPVCADKYEASIWQVSPNSSLVKKIQRGKVTLADLTAGGAIQLS